MAQKTVTACHGQTDIYLELAEKHLWELKELIYDTPYANPAPGTELPGFDLLVQKDLRYEIELNSNEEIINLFKMTPYYYKTGAADQKKAEAAQHLKTAIEFGIIVYRKFGDLL